MPTPLNEVSPSLLWIIHEFRPIITWRKEYIKYIASIFLQSKFKEPTRDLQLRK